MISFKFIEWYQFIHFSVFIYFIGILDNCIMREIGYGYTMEIYF